ncbi:MAG: alpha-mannosidase [Deinococcota bacterium]|jgi:alpha-mannosidase|nr:alpha-mannosidase [Deinococcota bacterium]
MRFFTEEKVAKLLEDIGPSIHREVHPIPAFRFLEGDPGGAHLPNFDDRAWQDFAIGSFWGGYDVVAWFRAVVVVPEPLMDKKLALRFLVGPRDGGESTAETLLYVNGEPLQAIDIWHEEAWLPPEHVRGGRVHLALKAWSGVLGVPEKRRFKLAQLLWLDEDAEGFYFLESSLLKAIGELDAGDWRRVRLLELADRAMHLVDFTKVRSDAYYRSLGEARRFLAEGLVALRGLEAGKPTVVGVGHSHIDLAWQWRLSHSREKAARTFSTVLHLMRQYPDYHFMHSSPQLYKFLSEDYPELFARVGEKIASGAWEVTGGMWVEPDINLPSGESLIRQLLYGKRYMRETFGVETKVLWLPDVFGYSWALPQILKGSGIDSFMTTKISWNQFNRFPHDTFRWRGLDGSEILTHFITTPERGSGHYTYNGEFLPWDIKGIWDNYRQKDLNDELLLAYGWGDGGGGPTREMLETVGVMKDLPGFPKVELGHVEPYFKRLNERLEDKDVPVWDGELYLEYHRGTYTSQAQVKRANRKAEVLYHEAEWLAALAAVLGGADYPDLREGWELILYNQFHDVLPGSSIREVYEDSAADYARIEVIGRKALQVAQDTVLGRLGLERESLVVFNALSWPRDGLVELPWTEALAAKMPSQVAQEGGQKTLLVHVQGVPSLGYRAYPLGPHFVEPREQSSVPSLLTPSPLTVSSRHLENAFYRLELSERGQIRSLFDKEHGREVLAPGARGNVFQVFQDKPLAFDAWDIDPFYQEKVREVTELAHAEVEEEGPLRATLRLTWRFYDSTITQQLSLYAHSRRIDFRSEVNWQEAQLLLKVAFPVNVRATRATYDIQFGNLERPTHWNTSWDWARFEVVGHKWADLSEGNYGVALLNDCKYGHDIRNSVMRLTLIKSAVRPDARADKGEHVFTYSLLPHAGTWREGEVVQEAYALNVPLRAALAAPGTTEGGLPGHFSFAEVSAEHVILETIKRAEEGDAWIVRVYESKQYRSDRVTLRFGRKVLRASRCNLVEEVVEEGDEPVLFEDDRLSFAIYPYEIKTFKIWLA